MDFCPSREVLPIHVEGLAIPGPSCESCYLPCRHPRYSQHRNEDGGEFVTVSFSRRVQNPVSNVTITAHPIRPSRTVMVPQEGYGLIAIDEEVLNCLDFVPCCNSSGLIQYVLCQIDHKISIIQEVLREVFTVFRIIECGGVISNLSSKNHLWSIHIKRLNHSAVDDHISGVV